MTHREKIVFNAILTDCDYQSKRQIIQSFYSAISDELKIKSDQKNVLNQQIFEQSFFTKDNILSSVTSEGAALLHTSLDGIRQPFSMLIKLKNTIRMNGNNDTPFDLVVCLISPKSDGPLHLRRLNRFSRLLRDSKFCSMIRNNHNKNDLQSLFMDFQEQILRAA